MFLNKESQRRIVSVCFIFFAAFMLSGCLGGGGGGGGSTVSSGLSTDPVPEIPKVVTFSESTPADDSGLVQTVHHPEPSSMLLLGSGLLGMLIAKRKKR